MKFYIVEHPNKEYSVQDNPKGGGVLLEVPFNPESKYEAILVCSAANKTLKIANLLDK